MSNTPRTDAVFLQARYTVDDDMQGSRTNYEVGRIKEVMESLETELATATARLAEIEAAARFPVGLSDRELQSLHNLGNECETAAVEIVSLRLHSKHLAAENMRMREEVEVLRCWGNKDCTAQADAELQRRHDARKEGK